MAQMYAHLKDNIGSAIEARARIADKGMEDLYKFICGHPSLSIYEISKKMNWSAGKVTYILGKLEELDVIKKIYKIEKNRSKLEICKKDWSESLPDESLKELKEIMKRKDI